MVDSNKSNIQNLNYSNFDFNIDGENPQDSLIKDNSILESSIYGTDLNDYLNSLNLNEIGKNQKIKIIIRFVETKSKQERIAVIDSLFDQYEILSNYDLISAVYCEVSLLELIKKEHLFSQNIHIEKIYKTKSVSQPVIRDDRLETSVLNQNEYPNWWISAIGAENLEYDGSGVNVTVIDSGVYDHPDLNIIARESTVTYGGGAGDLNGHGTHVAGIIGSNGASSGGLYRGVAPGVRLIDAQAGNVSGSLLDGDIISAIDWAVEQQKSNIISMSFGGGIFSNDSLLGDAISSAKDKYDTIFVASAGNSGPSYYSGGTPATHPDVISVGATNKDNELASFSSWGPSLTYLGFPDVVAPGVNIISTSAVDSVIEKQKRYVGDFFDYSGDSDYIPLSGTSMSCPVVSGAIAVLKQAFPSLTAETARIALMEGASSLSLTDENEILKSGGGLINVSASLEFLKEINSTHSDVNNVTRFFPDILPVKPFDLLHFPGDSQVFNLSVISGRDNTINIESPNIDGISLSLDNDQFIFLEAGINYSAIEITIDNDASPGERSFQINLTLNGKLIDTIDVKINVKLPEKKILMESYHGLNDWIENQFSFPQIGFYDAMKDLTDMNISVDYLMEFWQPYYDRDTDNYLLTEERLAQYDLVVLQTPILPYSPEEIANLVDYYNNHGNILYLGTRYQDVCSDNLNALFSELGLDTQIKEENIMLDQWVGIGTTLTPLPATMEESSLSEGVDKFYWLYGHSFNSNESSETIATVNNQTVAVAYDGSSQGKGNFIGFGDLNWLYYDYNIETDNYAQNHTRLLRNMMNYFFDDNSEISINLRLNTSRTNTDSFSISIYVKNLTTNLGVDNGTLNGNLKAYIDDGGSNYENIDLAYVEDGIAINNSIDIPGVVDSEPYKILVNITLGSETYNKTSKILNFNSLLIPQINNLSTNKEEVYKKNSITLLAKMDSAFYNDFKSYISLYSYNFHNKEKTVNETLTLKNNILPFSTYTAGLDLTGYPSGYGIYYITPYDGNYLTPNSPRRFFKISNNAPTISESSSYFQIGENAAKSFDDTTTDEGSLRPQSATQGDNILFEIDTTDGDNINSNLTVSVNFFMAVISEPVDEKSQISLIFADSFYLSLMNYFSDTQTFQGSLIVPSTQTFSSIEGTKSISTVASAQQGNYIGVLYINIVDSEGVSLEDPFFILLSINPPIDWTTIIIIIILIAAVIGIAALFYAVRRRKMEPEEAGRDYSQNYQQEWQQEQTEESSERAETPVEIGEVFFCPYCGNRIDSPKKFCPNCGKSLDFKN